MKNEPRPTGVEKSRLQSKKIRRKRGSESGELLPTAKATGARQRVVAIEAKHGGGDLQSFSSLR